MSRIKLQSGQGSKESSPEPSHPFNRHLATPPVEEVLIRPRKPSQAPVRDHRIAVLGKVGGSVLSGQHCIANLKPPDRNPSKA